MIDDIWIYNNIIYKCCKTLNHHHAAVAHLMARGIRVLNLSCVRIKIAFHKNGCLIRREHVTPKMIKNIYAE